MRLSYDLRTQLDRVLDAIAVAEAGPTEADLANAPVLDRWRIVMSGPHVLVLWGSVSGHPELGSDLVTTTPLIALNRSRGWARTKSRWYRLARSFAEFEAELAASLAVQEPGPSFLQFDLPGYQPIRDMELIAERLSAYILRVRAIDTADRTASKGEC